MGKNSKSNEKHTWTNSTALAPFLLLCAFPQDNPRIFPPPTSFLTYIYQPLKPKSVAKRKIPHFSFFIFFLL